MWEGVPSFHLWAPFSSNLQVLTNSQALPILLGFYVADEALGCWGVINLQLLFPQRWRVDRKLVPGKKLPPKGLSKSHLIYKNSGLVENGLFIWITRHPFQFYHSHRLGESKGFRSSVSYMGTKIKYIFLIINHNITDFNIAFRREEETHNSTHNTEFNYRWCSHSRWRLNDCSVTKGVTHNLSKKS